MPRLSNFISYGYIFNKQKRKKEKKKEKSKDGFWNKPMKRKYARGRGEINLISISVIGIYSAIFSRRNASA